MKIYTYYLNYLAVYLKMEMWLQNLLFKQERISEEHFCKLWYV